MKPGDVEIISARDTMHELPVLVFEGMQERLYHLLAIVDIQIKVNPTRVCDKEVPQERTAYLIEFL